MEPDYFSVTEKEVETWNGAIESQSIIEAISANRSGAIRFFGEAAVKRENPAELMQIAFARTILSLPDEAVRLKILNIDSTVDLLIQSGVADCERLKFGDGVRAIEEEQDNHTKKMPSSFLELWQAAAQDVYRENTLTDSEVSLMRESARRLIENVMR